MFKKMLATALVLALLVGGLAVFTPSVLGQVTSGQAPLAGRLYGGTGSAPTISGCATSAAANSTDTVGQITVASAAACTVTFGTAYAAAPACVAAQNTTAANNVTKVLTSTTAAVISFAAGPSASDVVSYICVGLRP